MSSICLFMQHFMYEFQIPTWISFLRNNCTKTTKKNLKIVLTSSNKYFRLCMSNTKFSFISDLQGLLFVHQKLSQILPNQLQPLQCLKEDDWGSINLQSPQSQITDPTIENSLQAMPSSLDFTGHPQQMQRRHPCSSWWRGRHPSQAQWSRKNPSECLKLLPLLMRVTQNCELNILNYLKIDTRFRLDYMKGKVIGI